MPIDVFPWPQNPGLSVLMWVLLAVLVLYGARTPAHHAILALARTVAQGCRLSSRALAELQTRLAARNREVILSSGLEDTERQIEQEFRRISATVDRDLARYPALHRKLTEQVTLIEEDFRRSTDAPPDPEAWDSALQAAKELLKQKGLNEAGAKAVGALHEGLEEARDLSLAAYRDASKQRHRLLSKMAPVWRRMEGTLNRMDRSVNSIFERARRIDALMDGYREISNGSARAEQTLSSSALTQFFIAGFVLVIASMGGFINFQLIALPMSEMVGATSQLGGMQTSDVAALVIILVEITMGIFLMESLRITRLFPIIGSMDGRMRRRMAWVTFSILFILASIEASLAYMRDLLAADRAALTQSLAGVAMERPEFLWIPSVGQMVMGFILPFALTFVAIPLESFVHASRTVGGYVVVGILRMFAFVLRLVGNVAKNLGRGFVHLYDIFIFLPLKIEELALGRWRDAESERGAGKTAATKAGVTTALVLSLLLAGCSSPAPRGTGVFLLLDTSGSYTEELERAQLITNYLLGVLDPGDSFGVARINAGSFTEKNILVRMTFDARPTMATSQKRQFKNTVDQFTDTVSSASHTDITGGLLQAVEWLNEVNPGRKTVLIFSDMEEDLPEGFVRDFPLDLTGVEVLAVNVTKLQPDNVDPRVYTSRLDAWRERIEAGGGTWTVVNDLERLDVALRL
ncbi:MAG: hypothetical protein WD995_13875 [Gemmatimonadota bacterium]